jgi:hypothetical protein
MVELLTPNVGIVFWRGTCLRVASRFRVATRFRRSPGRRENRRLSADNFAGDKSRARATGNGHGYQSVTGIVDKVLSLANIVQRMDHGELI